MLIKRTNEGPTRELFANVVRSNLVEGNGDSTAQLTPEEAELYPKLHFF